MHLDRGIRPPLSSERNIHAVDLFCGVGGLTHGLEIAGIDVRLGIDVDPACKFPYLANNKADFLLKPIEDLEAHELASVFPENCFQLLAGCAPCQTFSKYNRKAGPSDRRWWLLSEFSRLVQELSPELVTMENVPGLIEHDVFKKFVKNLDESGYKSSYCIVTCSEYGIPQRRERLVLLASKLGPISLLTPLELKSKVRTVRNAIGFLPPIRAGEIHEYDPLHRSAALSELNLRRIESSAPGGSWRDWNEDLIADCHKKKSGKTYPSVYGRMCWDEPSPTITTQFYGFGNGRFGHPEQNRAISLREGAILQSFPPDYSFVPLDDKIFFKMIGRLIGNAVPVKLGEVIGKSIIEHVSICTR